jgi:hypothetical protein
MVRLVYVLMLDDRCIDKKAFLIYEYLGFKHYQKALAYSMDSRMSLTLREYGGFWASKVLFVCLLSSTPLWKKKTEKIFSPPLLQFFPPLDLT